MIGMWNKFVNNFKLEVDLYLLTSEVLWTAIDIMNSIDISSYYVIVNNYKRKLVNKHPIKIRKFFFKYVNIKY